VEVKLVFHIKGTTKFEGTGEEVQTKQICVYEVGRGRRKLRNENLHDLHCSKSFMTVIISRRLKRRRRVARFDKKRPACRVLIDKPEGKTQLGKYGA
jgi:hypothetical protein